MEITKKEYLILGVGMILFVKLFDWSNYFMFIAFIFIILAFSNANEKKNKNKNE
ncbi:MAG: hypothetical protein KC469_09600 [Flavobacteriaceae bacterium]|nr:hypothetical protein [Flavobacteriaceae bacterium]